MSLTSSAGEVFLTITNDGRQAPIIIPGFDLTHDFTWSVWVYPTVNVPIDVSIHQGTDGSRILIGHNGFNWAYSSRYGSVAENTIYFNDVVYNRWAVICFAKHGNNISIGYGLQDTDDLNPSEYPVPISVVVNTTTDVVFDLAQFYLTVGHNQYMSNFKFWNSVLSVPDLQSQVNRFDVAGGTGAQPFWVSTLRTPGDVSNIANPRSGPDWMARHGFTSITDPASLVMGGDPAYMAKYTPCPTWIYPIIPTAASNFNPGTSPLVPTTYDASQFWDFADAGSISPVDGSLQSIEYFAYPSPSGSGYMASDSWGLWKDETGTKVVSNHTIPANRFEADTGIAIPAGSIGAIKISTMYAWQFGAQFTWQPHTPQGPTAMQMINFLYLYVVYIGYPTGVPVLPVQNLTGLFAINKGSHVDQYNRGTQLAIPAPTVRTAYIGQ